MHFGGGAGSRYSSARVLPFWVGVFFGGFGGLGGLNGLGICNGVKGLKDWYLVDSKFVIGDKK